MEKIKVNPGVFARLIPAVDAVPAKGEGKGKAGIPAIVELVRFERSAPKKGATLGKEDIKHVITSMPEELFDEMFTVSNA